MLCIIKMYSISIPQSETLSDPNISDKRYRNVKWGYLGAVPLAPANAVTDTTIADRRDAVPDGTPAADDTNSTSREFISRLSYILLLA
jgi:hypothetical protein